MRKGVPNISDGFRSRSVTKVLTGNHAAAYAAKLARAEVIAAYPITPQTTIIEKMSEFCASGELKATYINVESEFSALAANIGASLVGCRTFTATCSQGLALMHELLHWTANARLPIVMVNTNRGLAPPGHLLADHIDSLSQRDTGWLQLYCVNNQEVMDTVIQAFKIAEEVSLPCLVNMEGFNLSYTAEPVEIPPQELVDSYLGSSRPKFVIHPSEPVTFWAVSSDPTMVYEFKYRSHQAAKQALEVARDADETFYKMFGRKYGLIQGHRMEDAEIAIVSAGTNASTVMQTVDDLRRQGIKAGALKIRLFRPFPVDDVAAVLRQVPKVAVLDRDVSVGLGGIFFQEIKAALYGSSGAPPSLFGFMAGVGGVDVTPRLIADMVDYTLHHDVAPKEAIWMEVRS